MCYMSYVPTCQILELRRDFPAKLETRSGVQPGGALEGRATSGGRQAAETKRDLANPPFPKVVAQDTEDPGGLTLSPDLSAGLVAY